MRSIVAFGLGAVLNVVACGGSHPFTFDDGGTGGPDGSTTNDGGPNNTGDSGCPFCGVDASGDGGGGGGGCNPNPANFDVPGNGCDDDGDGIVDNAPGTCDSSLGTATGTAASDFAKAIGICPNKGDTWGVASAAYSTGYNKTTGAPSNQQYGTGTTFGTNVKARQGTVLGILSTGVAAAQDCNGVLGTQFKSNTCTTTGAGTPPPGYPKAVGNCPAGSGANDLVNVTLKIKVPANAKGFSFDFNFYSGEWPEWVCSDFNDAFVAWLSSTAWAGKNGDFNISLDGNSNPVNVNNNFFQVCSPANAKVGCDGTSGTAACSLGNSELLGTGFYIANDALCGNSKDSGGGATGWLTTQAPVTPGETITLQFMVWNTGDQAYDSSVLLDNWQWVATATTVNTGRPPN